jgi:hypothetical protein
MTRKDDVSTWSLKDLKKEDRRLPSVDVAPSAATSGIGVPRLRWPELRWLTAPANQSSANKGIESKCRIMRRGRWHA